MAARGLKTKIALNIAALLSLSALLTGIVVVLIVQLAMVGNYMDQQQQWLNTLSLQMMQPASGAPEGPADPSPQLNAAAGLLAQWPVRSVLCLSTSGEVRLAQGTDGPYSDMLHQAVQRTLLQGHAQRHYMDLEWAVVWWHAKTAVFTLPVYKADRLVGAGGAVVSLEPVFARLIKYRLLILLYILINSSVLTLIGLYRIFRIYLRPIDRMVVQAETYGDEDDFLFSFRREDNELNKLSRALNRMLGRIAKDRQKLEESVRSLAEANRELKSAQNDIIRAEKMASVGRLAAGVAHEIGNPIGIVLGYLDLLKQDDLEPAERLDFLERSEEEIQRINTVIGQLLDLARPKPARPQVISVRETIGDFVAAMRPQPMLSDIAIHTDCQAEQDAVYANADQLHQVLLNMLINAADAIGEAGDKNGAAITITTTNAIDETNSPELPHGPGTWVLIAVHDTGSGISPDQLPNVFDPFFSTKAPGKGTGLGLAVSYMIIEKMGGDIMAQSSPGQGTTFTIRLPHNDQAPD